MRNFLDSILIFIGATSLTDDEFDTVTASLPLYNQSTYNDLSKILAEREAISDMQDKLLAFYKAKGFDVSATDTGKSNILFGSPL